MQIETKEQVYARKKKESIFLPRAIVIDSDLFWSLPKTAIRVYFILKGCLKVELVRVRKTNDKIWKTINNGELQLTYKTAKEKYGICNESFRKAIDSLIEKGFIDISHQGQGAKNDFSLYSISERWKDYGTDRFISVQRERRKNGFGNRY